MSRAGRFALAAAGGLLQALSLPLVIPGFSLRQVDPAGILEVVAWVGLVPALLALQAASGPVEAAFLGLVSGAAAFYVIIYWVSHAMTAFGGLSQGIAFVGLSALVLYMAAHWAMAFWASFTIGRGTGLPQWIHFPLAWVATEFCRNYLFTGYPWGNLGYTQVRNGPVAQLASLGGVYAVAGLVVLVNCVAAHWWRAIRAGPGGPRPWRSTAVAAAALLATLGWGSWNLARVRREMASAPWVKVGLVQANVSQEVKNQGPRHAEQIIARMWPLTLEADRQGAALVAWPEASWPFALPPRLPGLRSVAPDLPPLQKAHLLLGATTVQWTQGPEGRQAQVENSAFLLAPDLRVLDRYVKHHLVPFGEYVPLRDWLPFLRSVVPTMAPHRGRWAAGAHVLRERRPPDHLRPHDLLRRHLPGGGPHLRPPGGRLPGEPHQRRLVRLLVRPVPVPRHRAHAGHRDREVGGPAGLCRRERHHLPHRRARPGRPGGRSRRSRAGARPGRAAAPARGRPAHLAGSDALH